MESAIRLCYSPLPSAPPCQFHGTNVSSYARASRIHLKFNHVSTRRLSHLSMRQQVTRSSSRVNCMLNNRSSMPSENEGSSDNKILRGVTGASLALACVVGLFNLSSKFNPKFNTAYAAPWPFSNANMSSEVGDESILPGSKDALDSIWQMINTDHSKQTRPKIDKEPDDNTIHSLKVYAVGLSKSGNKDEALKLLEDTYNEYKECESARLNLGLALVELLIIQGNFEKARDRLHSILSYEKQFSSDDLKQLLEEYNNSGTEYEKYLISQILLYKLLVEYNNSGTEFEKYSISQILLYKAIIHTMLKNKEAAKWWEAFIITLNGNE